jgi:hypothetical protein
MSSLSEPTDKTNNINEFLDDIVGSMGDAQREVEATILHLDTLFWALENHSPITENDLQIIAHQARTARGNLENAWSAYLAERNARSEADRKETATANARRPAKKGAERQAGGAR